MVPGDTGGLYRYYGEFTSVERAQSIDEVLRSPATCLMECGNMSCLGLPGVKFRHAVHWTLKVWWSLLR
jgi:hypothetical protein